MQKKNVCYICSKKFSRRWNLERHLYDVHEVHNDLSNDSSIKQEIDMLDHLSNMVEPAHKFQNKEDNNMNQMQYNQSYYNNNFPNNLPCYYNNT